MLPTLAQKAPVLSQLELPVEPTSGSSPKWLHGLPSGTGPANSAVAWRETFVAPRPRNPPKKLVTVESTSTRRRVEPPASDGETTARLTPLVNPFVAAYRWASA